jgi:O-antigen/teichoic acid export membrane protein
VVVYGDRFLIGALLPVSAVGYYSTASEIATKMWLIPTSLLKTLFPAFSALTVAGSREVELLYERSLKFLLLTMAFPVAILMVLGSQILSVWLGGNFALHSGPLLRVLALGAFFNSLTAVPYALLQGAGRPDITAKLYLIQLPLYGCCCWALLRSFGMFGAALGWTLRMGAEACVFFLLCRRIFPGAAWLSRSTGVRAAGLVTGGVLIGALAVANLESKSTALQAGIAASLLGLEAILSWRYALQVEDRSAIRRILRMLMVGAGSDRRTSVSDQRAGAATLEGDRMASRAGGPRLANAPSADAVRDA